MLRILHASDLHLRHRLPGTSAITRRLCRRMPVMFERLVARIADERPDLVVLSGDLLDYPAYALRDDDMMKRGESDLGLIREGLDSTNRPYIVVRGNHDHPGLVSKVFRHVAADLTIAGHRVLAFNDDEHDRHVPQRIDRERRRFLDALADESSLPQVHVQHHLVWPELNEGYPHAYREAAHMREIIAHSGRVRLVLSGHYHKGVGLEKKEGVHYATVPAFCDAPHSYRVCEINGDTVTSREEKLLDPSRLLQPVVFLDRDGCMSVEATFRGAPEDFRLLPQTPAALRKLKGAGYALVVISSQTGVGHGWTTVPLVARTNDRMSLEIMERAGLNLDGVYCCYHSPDAILSEYRAENHPDLKPNPGLLLRAAAELGLDVTRSWMIGDRASDLEAGRAVGAKTILVLTGDGASTRAKLDGGLADAVVGNIADAADRILAFGRS